MGLNIFNPSSTSALRDKMYGNTNSGPSLDLQFAKYKSLEDYVTGKNLITFTRGSAATYVDSNGVIQTAATDEARFDHDPTTGESLGLLVEEERTNIDPNSLNQPASSATFLNVNISITTGAIAPDGTSNFKTFTTTSSTNILRSYYSFPISVTAGEVWTTSIYVDANNSSEGRMIFSVGNAGAQYLFGYMDINVDKTISVSFPTAGQSHLATFTPINSGYQSLGNNIYRVWYTHNVVATGSPYLGMGLYPQSNRPLGWSISVWGSQIEKGSFPTSYIPTSGSTVTRAADNASITGSNFSSWWNPAKEGTLYFSHNLTPETQIGNPSNSMIIAFATSLTFYNGPVIGLWGSGGNRYFPTDYFYGTYNNDGWSPRTDVLANLGINLSDPGFDKYAVGYKVGTGLTNLAINGELLGAKDTSDSYIPTGLYFGGSHNQHISRLTYFPDRLPDATLQAITS